jgi:hypothetical protein
MMNDDLSAIAGKYEELVGRLQEKYGIASERSHRQDDDYKRIVEELKMSNARLMKLEGPNKKATATPKKIKRKNSTGAKRRQHARA